MQYFLCKLLRIARAHTYTICQPFKWTNASNLGVCRTSNTSGVFLGDGAIKLTTEDRGPESMLQFRTALAVLPNDQITNKGFLVPFGHSSPRDSFAAIERPVNQGFLPEPIATPILLCHRISILINKYLVIETFFEALKSFGYDWWTHSNSVNLQVPSYKMRLFQIMIQSFQLWLSKQNF